jgi:hypothetical protein
MQASYDIAGAAIGEAAQIAPSAARAREERAARLVFVAVTAYTAALTIVWLVLLISGRDGGAIFAGVRPDRTSLTRLVAFQAVFMFGYGWLWYRVRRALLLRVVGLREPQLEAVFGTRTGRSFDLDAILAGRSERAIRIVDMIGRRGRSLTLAFVYAGYVYLRIADGREPRFLTAALADGLLDALAMSWLYVLAFRSDGALGRIVYGAPARLMDGRLGRANLLSVVTLWSAFKFVMVPLGARLAPLFPPSQWAALFGFIWLSYMVSDTAAELVGCTLGRMTIRVRGLGAVNRKSLEGTIACFVGSLVTCLALVVGNRLPPVWLGLALVVSVSNTLLEVGSPRGTDDFTMATANALICWAFGAWLI